MLTRMLCYFVEPYTKKWARAEIRRKCRLTRQVTLEYLSGVLIELSHKSSHTVGWLEPFLSIKQTKVHVFISRNIKTVSN
jgi:hypothetical protein